MSSTRTPSRLWAMVVAGALLFPGCTHDMVAPSPMEVSVSPTTWRVPVGNSRDFTAYVRHDGRGGGVTWTLTGAGCTGAACGTLSATRSNSGVPITYTAPSAVPTPATVALAAMSETDEAVTGLAMITIAPQVVVTLDGNFSVDIGGQQQISASIANDPSGAGVSWTATCATAACGTIAPASSASGSPVTYTARGIVPNPSAVTIRATSVADPSRFAELTVTVTSQIQVAVNPGGSPAEPIWLLFWDTQQFSATVTNDPGNLGVTWSVNASPEWECDCGSITPDGLFTPDSPTGYLPNYRVVATSIADYTKTASATVMINYNDP